ncbi:ATP-dependent zinc metalloprotease FtsH [Candidatus Methylospira mobilis]|uniref:ATP-dependent zinc metalloprotease FtsH n=1 Tax=Candidatus Methylospira mobilis TaxID=1808979 RepID=A0A5Q0BR97_9GAMM|nr:ATP-dependent zinc metalloprotease FtsH [Candidatus Methylospira mobilis]QFY44821.1 ATP-dependent zinc metalloprotease FtsH [Candidatus Methylospira mobilis]
MNKHTLLEFLRKGAEDLRRKLTEYFDTLTAKHEPRIDLKSSGTNGIRANLQSNSIFYILLVIAMLYFWQGYQEARQQEIPYSLFLQYVNEQRIQEAVVTEQVIFGTLKPDPADAVVRHFSTVPLWNQALAESMEKQGVKYTVRYGSNWFGNFIFNWLLPISFMLLLWGWMARRFTAGRGTLNLGRNRIRIHADSLPKVTFNDVAGAEDAKQELKETIEFLQNPARIQRLGGHMPKGVLLVGPPGTGKTLLARAVAGEAGVPFFNIGGSEFIEMFVGMGASRVRDLFDQARQKAPCIIFIDELDAIGRSRGGPAVMGGHDEREQTLNQLLTEMDGFDPSVGVIVMAATNRPEILDSALLRAGRFDRQIVVDKPGLEDRIAILALHTKNMKLGNDIDLRVIAQRTPGFVGADLANIANEAAIIAVRDHCDDIDMKRFEAAIDRVLAGPEKRNRTLNEAEKRRVAYHESGHALVAETVPTGEPVHKVSIIPRGVAALGYTLQLPVEEKFLSTEAELKDQLAILLGGRTAEYLVFGCVSSGAQNDLEKASEIARAMVCQLGMSKILGPLSYGKRQRLQYLNVEGPEERNFSEETARLIDTEVRALLEDSQRRAQEILEHKRAALDAVAKLLQEKEVVSGAEIKGVIRDKGD